MDRDVLKVLDAHLPTATLNLLMIARARGAPLRERVELWLAGLEGESEVAAINRDLTEQQQEQAEPAAPEHVEPEQPPAAVDIDMGVIRELLEAALVDSNPTALAREIGITPQSLKGVVAGSEPYGKTRKKLAEWGG